MNAKITSVLVLDDEDILRESLAMFLESHDFEVTEASSGEAALDALGRHPADVAIVDIRLPGMTGLEFIEQARRRWPRLHFLIYTGSTEFRLGQETAAAGVRPPDIFAKPLADLNVLAEAVRRVREPGEDP